MECQRCKEDNEFRIKMQEQFLENYNAFKKDTSESFSERQYILTAPKKHCLKRNLDWLIPLVTIIFSLGICAIVLYFNNELVNAVFKGFGCAYLGMGMTWLFKQFID